MSRDSRFDKLETDRGNEAGEGPRRALEGRFGAEPERAPAPAPAVAHAPVMEAALDASPESPEATAPQLKRFEADGAEHLQLDTDELTRLPFLRCPECQRDSSRFDKRCISCGASLESTAARELNLSILATFDEERAREATAHREAHEQSIKQLVEDEFRKHEKAEQALQVDVVLRTRLGLVGGAVVCIGLALLLRSFCASGFLVTVALALVVAALPHGARAALTAHVRRPWRL